MTVNEIMKLADSWETEVIRFMSNQAGTESIHAAKKALRTAIEELAADAARYQFIRDGGAYMEPNQYDEDGAKKSEMYMATDNGGKYYHDMRDLDMDLDAAMKGST